MTELLLAVVERQPPALPSGALGEPTTTAIPTTEGTIFAIHVSSDVDVGVEQLESPEWIAPRALHCDDVVRSCTTANVLPFRFGTVYSDQAALTRRIEELTDDLRFEFDRLRQVDEYRLRIRVARPRTTAATSGADYLRSRRDALAGRSAQTAAIERALFDGAEGAVVTVLSADEVAAHVLCSQGDWERLVTSLSDIVDRIEYEGPLPPYHFVEVGDGAS